ncbi:MAG: hybrid sensor histidine kinase/response regulator [Candidatus Sumerlaeaceae bacterium]
MSDLPTINSEPTSGIPGGEVIPVGAAIPREQSKDHGQDMENLFAADRLVVLLVDDQPMIGEAVRRLLAGEGEIEFHYCSSSNDALEKARTISPTVILQDLVMPDMDGLELLKLYRSTPETRNVPVIVLSTKEEASVKKQAFELGASDYLVKLPDRIELIARIRHHSQAYMNRVQRDAAMRALDLALKRKNEFMRIASHDLKNPLTVVIGASSLLKDLTSPHTDLPWMETVTKMIATVQRQAEQMHKLIVDYLDAQAMEDGQLKIEPTENNLNQLAKNAVSDLDAYTTTKGTLVDFDLDENLPSSSFDAARVAQVAVNLISNAVKFSPPGASVTVRTRKSDGLPGAESSQQPGAEGTFLVFEVSDNGPGLQPEDLAKLFGRYATLSAKPTGGEKSTGLGLAICKSLIELHGGRIGARNNAPGHPGSTFWFALPALAAHAGCDAG